MGVVVQTTAAPVLVVPLDPAGEQNAPAVTPLTPESAVVAVVGEVRGGLVVAGRVDVGLAVAVAVVAGADVVEVATPVVVVASILLEDPQPARLSTRRPAASRPVTVIGTRPPTPSRSPSARHLAGAVAINLGDPYNAAARCQVRAMLANLV